ncbi:glycosyltransferase family 1 protein [bacterium]|nr:MAG: glycosyltransferase family 1 protein [bacterium]
MKIGINASFLRKPDTGIGQVTRGFLGELIKNYSDKNEYFLYLEKDIDLKLPKNFEKRVFLPILWKRDDLIRKIWWEKFLLPRKIKKDKCDLFISLYQPPTFLKNTKHAMLVHDMVPKIFPEYLDNWRKKFYYYLSCRAIKHADKIITVSEWSKRDIHKYLKISDDRIEVAYPGAGKEFLGEIDWEKDNQVLEKYDIFGRYIFYLGGFDFRKNVSGLLVAYKLLLLKDNAEDVNLVLGGEDKSKYSPLFTDIKKEIKELELENRVKITGFIDQKDLPAIYRHAELFVLPSLYEGFGLMVLEAMASGTPTAISKSSSLPEIGGDAVLYFNPYDAEEMARVIGKVLRNDKLKKRLSEKGKKRTRKFQWKDFVKAFFK